LVYETFRSPLIDVFDVFVAKNSTNSGKPNDLLPLSRCIILFPVNLLRYQTNSL